MLTKTSIISFLMLITFPLDGEGLKDGSEEWSTRMPSRLQGRNVSFRRFILHGTPAYIEEYPHKLSIRQQGTFFCGASVISSQWALTAAHCLERISSPNDITVYGGSSSRVTGGVEFDVAEFTLHPDYDPFILDFDVAVIKIKDSFDGYRNIRRVVLAKERCRTVEGTQVRLAGWGYNEHGLLPEDLYEIGQCIMNQNECFELWGGDITSRMLCATVENGVDSCNGDSGGAVLKGCLQVGIISFGSTECGFSIPSVFTRIEDPAIRGFIRSTTGV